MSNKNNDQQFLARLSLALFIIGGLGGILIGSWAPSMGILFFGVALLMTLVFGIISWNQKMGKVSAVIAGATIVIGLLVSAFLWISTLDTGNPQVRSGQSDTFTEEEPAAHSKEPAAPSE